MESGDRSWAPRIPSCAAETRDPVCQRQDRASDPGWRPGDSRPTGPGGPGSTERRLVDAWFEFRLLNALRQCGVFER